MVCVMERHPLWASWWEMCGGRKERLRVAWAPQRGKLFLEDFPTAATPSGVRQRCRPTGTMRQSKSALLASPCSVPHPTCAQSFSGRTCGSTGPGTWTEVVDSVTSN